MKKYLKTVISILIYAFLSAILLSCGGSGGGGGSSSSSTPTTSTPEPSNTVPISGNVAAPNGSISSELSANRPQAELLARSTGLTRSIDAEVTRPGASAVGAGVTINLIEIDSSGNQVGEVIATTTTDRSGNYTLYAPSGFTAASKYVVQAVDSNVSMQSFVTSTTVNVDPYTQATVILITNSTASAGTNITAVSLADIAAVQETVLQHSADVSTSSTSATQLTSDLRQVVANNAESTNIVASIANPGGLTGTVTDNTGPVPTPVANVQIKVMTFGNLVTQANIRTDAAGGYTVHVPAGDYIIGAINDTTTSMAASQWWTSGVGGTKSVFAAEKVTVGTTTVTKDFSLSAGGRISGTVTARDTTGEALPGIVITLRDFTSAQSLMGIRTLPGGTYSLNVSPGAYYLSFRSNTLNPYATASYNSALPGGGFNRSEAERLSITEGASISASIGLNAGYKIEGIVSDPVSGPVAGISVRFYDSTGAFVEGMPTGINGGYRIWLQPGTYDMKTRGQIASNLDVTSASLTQSFTAAVGQITGVLLDAYNNPVSQAYVSLWDNTGSSPTYNNLGHEVSDGDGSFTVYTISPTTSVFLLSQIDTGKEIGSSIYLNKVQLLSGTAVAAPAEGSTTELGTINLPAGAILSGTVTKGGLPAGNKLLQVRTTGKGSNSRFLYMRTMSDGSYSTSLPVNTTYKRVCVYDLGTSCPSTGSGSGTGTTYAFFDNVVTGAEGTTTTQNFAY
jgi:hypothetical protein